VSVHENAKKAEAVWYS